MKITHLGFFVVLFASLNAHAEWASFDAKELNLGKRLVQTSETERSWLTHEQMHELSEVAHQKGRCGNFMDVTDFPELPKVYRAPLKTLEVRQVKQQATVVPLLREMAARNLHASVSTLSAFPNRYFQNETGAQAATWIRDQFIAMARGRSDVSVELVKHNFKMPSVIARIRGNGRLAVQSVVLGAHADSIHLSGFGRPNPAGLAPGADDDASGVASLLEAFRVIVQSGYRPERTLEFMAYAGEEGGLLGSQAISRAYAQQKRDVVAVLQLDMVSFPGTFRKITFVTDHVNQALTEFTMKLVDAYIRIPYATDKCGYACSDHASWNKAGYAAAYPFESPFQHHNRAIHTPRDTINQTIDMEWGLHFSKLAMAFAVEISKD